MMKISLAYAPYVRIVVPLSLGIILSSWLEYLPPYSGCIITLSALGVAYLSEQQYEYRNRWMFGTVYATFLVLFGYCYSLWYNELNQSTHFSKQEQPVQYSVGTIYEAPSKGNRLKVPVRVEAAGSGFDLLKPASGNVLLFLEITPETELLRYGDRIGVRAVVRHTQPTSNPHAFDYGRYLHFQNIHYQAFVRPDSVVVLSTGHGYALWRAAYGWRDRLLGILHHHFPNQDEYAVASALLVGYKDDLSEDLRTAYAETGSMHALAVSGTHVSMLYAAIMFLLFRLPLYGRKGRYVESIIALLLIWAFTFVTGATASVLRASVMFTIFLIGRATFQSTSVWNTLANSAFILLIFNPYLLFDAGFQLSYAAVAGMVYFYPLFLRKSPRFPYWILDEGWKVLLIGFAAQIGTLPLSLFYFHQFPIYFWLAGWIVVFGGAVFMGAGAVLVLLDAFIPVAAEWLGFLLYYLLWGMNQLIVGIQHLPGSVISGIWLAGWAAFLMYIMIALWGVGLGEKRDGGKWYWGAMGIAVFLLLCRGINMISQHHQRSMVVYSVSKSRLIDFFDGSSVVSLSDTLTKKQWTFAAQSNRWAMGMQIQDLYHFADSTGEAPNFRYEAPLIQFFDQHIALIDHAQWINNFHPSPSIPIDIMVLSKSPRLSISACQEVFPSKLVIADNTNSRRKVAQWKAECEALQIPFHDVREQGAWTLNISSK